MTKTYAITEEQRGKWLAKLKACDLSSDDSDLITVVIDGLHSLPLITGEPVASVKSFTSGSYHRNYQLDWYKDVPVSTKLYTHPQPLQPITADDVTDAMVHESCFVNVFNAKHQIATIFNLVIKHKGDTK